MNKIIKMAYIVILLFFFANCSFKNDSINYSSVSTHESSDYDMVVAVYEHRDSVTGEISLLPFDSLYPEEQDSIYKPNPDSFRELNEEPDPLLFVRFDSLDVKDKKLSEIIAVYGKPKETIIDTLRYGMCANGMEFNDGFLEAEDFRDTPFVIIIRKIWEIDRNHNLELYFKDTGEKDTVPFDGWLGDKWEE